MQEMLDVNIYQVVGMLEKFKMRLWERKSHSGVIIVSSIAAEIPGLPTNFTYGGTKVFGKYLTMATDWENKLGSEHQIDMLALQPHFVSTKMIEKFEKKGHAFGSVSVESCVGAALRDLGTEQRTYGPY